ncbi:MAG: 5'/3'-nucleotidase SurE [Actinomycetota bacterium]|nr:5'/3'-nucleotidase SurE [Actinomycetota bacterium]
MRILLTNDDGIDSIGLHVLARAMRRHGEVVIAAPDREYSGAGAAVGALHLMRPEVQRVTIEGIDEAWAVTGAPALCVMFARLGVFGPPFDLVVSGINPGANVGRSVYHSGTVGACLTARTGGISGVAVSQAVTGFGVEGQGWDDMVRGQRWDTAAAVADVVVGGLIADPPAEPVVLNVNVPNLPLEQITAWRRAVVGVQLPRSMAAAHMEPKEGHEGAFYVKMKWGDPVALPVETDGGAVEAGEVAISYLTHISALDLPPGTGAEQALAALIDAAG